MTRYNEIARLGNGLLKPSKAEPDVQSTLFRVVNDFVDDYLGWKSGSWWYHYRDLDRRLDIETDAPRIYTTEGDTLVCQLVMRAASPNPKGGWAYQFQVKATPKGRHHVIVDISGQTEKVDMRAIDCGTLFGRAYKEIRAIAADTGKRLAPKTKRAR